MDSLKCAVNFIKNEIYPELETVQKVRVELNGIASELSNSLNLDIKCLPNSMAATTLFLFLYNEKLLSCDIKNEMIHIKNFGFRNLEKCIPISELQNLESVVCECLTTDFCLEIFRSIALDKVIIELKDINNITIPRTNIRKSIIKEPIHDDVINNYVNYLRD